MSQEVRKLQKTGGSTFILSLPKRWVVAAGLKAGDNIFVDSLDDGSLSLKTEPATIRKVRRKVVEVKGEEPREHILRELIGAYISGHDVIEVHFRPESRPSIRRVAREFARMAMGVEMTEEGRSSIVLQDLSDLSELSPEKCLRRMYMSVKAMHEEALGVMGTADREHAEDVRQMDEDIDRLYWLVAKQCSLANLYGDATVDNLTKAGIHDYHFAAKTLERIGDHAERIAGAAERVGGKIDPRLAKDLLAAGMAALRILDSAFAALMSGDIDAANKAADEGEKVQKMVDSLTHRVAVYKGEELLALSAIVDSISRTGGYATDIAEIAINHLLSQPSIATDE
jgi:phosphate uptake regulator